MPAGQERYYKLAVFGLLLGTACLMFHQVVTTKLAPPPSANAQIRVVQLDNDAGAVNTAGGRESSLITEAPPAAGSDGPWKNGSLCRTVRSATPLSALGPAAGPQGYQQVQLKSPSVCIHLSTTSVIYNFSSVADMHRAHAAQPLDPRLVQSQGPIADRDVYPCVEDTESRDLPPYIYVPMPCFERHHEGDEALLGAEKAPLVQRSCGCEDRVATVDDVFVRIPSRRWDGSLQGYPVAVTRVNCGEKTPSVLAAIDRTGERLDYLRCVGKSEYLVVSYNELLQLLPTNVVEGEHREVYYTIAHTNHFPGHVFEALVTLMAHYFNAGLHRRLVPWLLTKEAPGKGMTSFESFFTEVASLLHFADPQVLIPVTYAMAGREPGREAAAKGTQRKSSHSKGHGSSIDVKSVYHFDRVHFAGVWYGMRTSCAYPWVANYLIPAALKKATSIGLSEAPVYRRVVIGLKIGGGARSFSNSIYFSQFLERHGFHVPAGGRTLSLTERIWHSDNADFIITGWGSSSTILMNTLNITRGRDLRVLLLVHHGYSFEFEGYFRGSPGHWPGENQVPRNGEVFYGLLQRRDGHLVDACGDEHFRVKILRLTSLDELRESDLMF